MRFILAATVFALCLLVCGGFCRQVLKKTFEWDVISCDEQIPAAGPCAEKFISLASGLYNGSELWAVGHARGIRFFEHNSLGQLEFLADYESQCSDLSVDFYGDSFYITNGLSISCNCKAPGILPCPPQLQLVSPPEIAGYLFFEEATTSPPVSSLTSTINTTAVLVQSGADNSTYGCEPFTNAAAIRGHIAVIDRGACAFQTKLDHAVAAGAIAAVVVNREGASATLMTITNSSIPAILISYDDGQLFRANLTAEVPVFMAMGPSIGSRELITNPQGSSPLGIGRIRAADIIAAAPEGTVDNIDTSTTALSRGISKTLDVDRGHIWIESPNGETGIIRVYQLPAVSFVAELQNMSDLLSLRFFSRGALHYLVGANYFENTVEVYDVTDLSNVQRVAVMNLGYSENVEIAPDNRTLYVESGLTNSSTSLLVVDLGVGEGGTIDTPVPLEYITIGNVPGSRIRALAVDMFGYDPQTGSGGHLYVGWASEGVAVYDLSYGTQHPVLEDIFDTSPAKSEYSVGVTGILVSKKKTDGKQIFVTNKAGHEQVLGMLVTKESIGESGGSTRQETSGGATRGSLITVSCLVVLLLGVAL